MHSPSQSTSPVTTHLFLGWKLVAEPMAIWWDRLETQLTNSSVQTQKPLTIFTPNPEIVVAAHHNPAFHQTVSQADYLIPDGIGLILATRWQRAMGKLSQVIPERIAGVDVAAQLLDLAAKENWRVLVIGGRDYLSGTVPAGQPAQHLSQLPGQVWWLPGYAQVAQRLPAEESQVLAELDRLKPAIVLVAFGAPNQETWVISHQADLQKTGVRLAMTVGGAMDALLGKVPRAPQALRQLGLEWLYRLLRQPWRLWRQLALIEFVGLMLFS